MNTQPLRTICVVLTERPFGGVHEYGKILMGKAMRAIVQVGRIEREWSVELDLTFDREVVEKAQRL